MVQLPVRQSGICPHPPKKKSKGETSEGSIHPEFRIFFRSEGVKPCGTAGHSLKDRLRSSQYPTPSISIWASSLGCCPWHVQLVRKPQGRLRNPSPVSLSLWQLVKGTLLWLIWPCWLWYWWEFIINLVGNEDDSLLIIFTFLSVMIDCINGLYAENCWLHYLCVLITWKNGAKK